MQTQTLTRRGILAGTALAALAGANVTATRALAEAVDPDAHLLSLFRRWEQAQRGLQAMASTVDDDTFGAASDAADAILMEIAGIPATGPTGWAVKAYAFAHLMYGGARPDYAAIDVPDAEAEHGTKLSAMLTSILADSASLGVGSYVAPAVA